MAVNMQHMCCSGTIYNPSVWQDIGFIITFSQQQIFEIQAQKDWLPETVPLAEWVPLWQANWINDKECLSLFNNIQRYRMRSSQSFLNAARATALIVSPALVSFSLLNSFQQMGEQTIKQKKASNATSQHSGGLFNLWRPKHDRS